MVLAASHAQVDVEPRHDVRIRVPAVFSLEAALSTARDPIERLDLRTAVRNEKARCLRSTSAHTEPLPRPHRRTGALLGLRTAIVFQSKKAKGYEVNSTFPARSTLTPGRGENLTKGGRARIVGAWSTASHTWASKALRVTQKVVGRAGEPAISAVLDHLCSGDDVPLCREPSGVSSPFVGTCSSLAIGTSLTQTMRQHAGPCPAPW